MLPENQIKGFRTTRLGMRIYRDRLVRRTDPRGRPYFWIGGEIPTGIPQEGTDIGALAEGYVSLTPLQINLAAYQALQRIDGWELGLTLRRNRRFQCTPAEPAPAMVLLRLSKSGG